VTPRKGRGPITDAASRAPIVECLGTARDDTAPEAPLQPKLKIVVTPVPRPPGYFTARLDGTSIVLCTTRWPFVECARRLIDLGHDPEGRLEMWHAGADAFCLRAPLGLAAKLTVEESAHGPVFRRHRTPPQSAVDALRTRSNTEGLLPQAGPLRVSSERPTVLVLAAGIGKVCR
jgi:hypothetical protein